MTSYAIILTHNRPTLLSQTVDAVALQVSLVVILDNASTPPVHQTWDAENYMLMRDSTQPPNIAKMWNDGLTMIEGAERAAHNTTWEVAILCDDAPPPPGWFVRVSTAMRKHHVIAASTHSYHPIDLPYTLTDLTNDPNRMCPWAFVLAGEAGIRADPRLRIHYQDTDVDWQARKRGGTLIAPGPVVPNLRVGENPDRPEYAHIIAEDQRVFNEKWGIG